MQISTEKAFKHCVTNSNTSKPEWSRTNFSLCLTLDPYYDPTIDVRCLQIILLVSFLKYVRYTEVFCCFVDLSTETYEKSRGNTNMRLCDLTLIVESISVHLAQARASVSAQFCTHKLVCGVWSEDNTCHSCRTAAHQFVIIWGATQRQE